MSLVGTIDEKEQNQTAQQCSAAVNSNIEQPAGSARNKQLMEFVCGGIENAKCPCTKPACRKRAFFFQAVRHHRCTGEQPQDEIQRKMSDFSDEKHHGSVGAAL